MKLIKDGNLVSWINSLLILIGGNISLATIKFCPNGSMEQIIYGTIGLILGGIGGYSAQARTLKRKPFGDLTFPPNKLGEKALPESLLEKIIDWSFLIGLVLSIYFWYFTDAIV